MKALILLLTSLATVTMAKPKVSFENVVRYSETVSGNKIEIAIHQRKFNFSDYEITGGTNGSKGHAKVNGVYFAGTDGLSPIPRISGWPEIETIAEIELKWNGKLIPVSKLLHINLLNLTLDSDSIQFIPRPSGEEILIQATGGDGGASYLVSLVLRKNGKHKQYECGYWESRLRKHPFEIEEFVKEKSGDTVTKSFYWLEPKKEPELKKD